MKEKSPIYALDCESLIVSNRSRSEKVVGLVEEKGVVHQDVSMGYPEIILFEKTITDSRKILIRRKRYHQFDGLEHTPEILEVRITNQRSDQLGYSATYQITSPANTKYSEGLVDLSVWWLKDIGRTLINSHNQFKDNRYGEGVVDNKICLETYAVVLGIAEAALAGN